MREREDVLLDDANLRSWKRAHGVPDAPDDLVRLIANDWIWHQDMGKQPDEIRAALLRDHGAKIARYDAGHRDDPRHVTGTAMRDEAVRAREAARSRFVRGGGDSETIDTVYALGEGAITAGLGVAGAASGVGAVGVAGAGVAGALDALMQTGKEGRLLDGGVSVAVNLATFGVAAKAGALLEGLGPALRARFAGAVSHIAKGADEAGAIWDTTGGRVVSSLMQSYASAVTQNKVKGETTPEQDR